MDTTKTELDSTQLAQFIAGLNIAAIGLNSQNNIVLLNAQCEKSLQIDLQAVYLTPIDDLIPKASSYIKKSREKQDFQFDLSIRRPQSDPLDIRLFISFYPRSFPIVTTQISTLMTFEEISVEYESRQKQKQQNELEMLSRYSGEVAHDLNNILNVISGHLEILELEVKDHIRMKKRVDAALKGVNRGRVLSARLSHLAFHDKADMSVCNLNRVVDDSLDLMQEMIAKEVRLTLKPSEEPLYINIDISHFIDVLLNLCMNASHAMQGSGEIRITTAKVAGAELGKNVDYASVSIEDTGCGIKKEIQNKIFDPFFTTKMNNKGSGIGLNLVKNYMEIHQGFVTLSSEVDKGACFSLYFPEVKKAVNEPSLNKDDDMGVEQKLEGKSVLVVDDEAPILLLLKEFLGIYGIKVQTAPTGSEGLNLACEQDFDLILSDLVMPGEIDGAEFACQLLKQKPDSSIIFMSGYTDNRLTDKEELRHIPVISKPFRKKELLNEMETALN